MNAPDFYNELNAAITVCDKDGNILYMNNKSAKTFEKYGADKLVSKNLLDCHPEPSKTKLKGMLTNKDTNAYTIEKNGIKKLIYQTPWFTDGEYMGYVEMSFEIPMEMNHFVRQNS